MVAKTKITANLDKAAKAAASANASAPVAQYDRPDFSKDTLANVVKKARVSYTRGQDLMLTAACCVAECKTRVEQSIKDWSDNKTGEAPKAIKTWSAFAAQNFPNMGERRLRELVAIGAADNPAQALLISRERNTARQTAHRERQQEPETASMTQEEFKKLAPADQTKVALKDKKAAERAAEQARKAAEKVQKDAEKARAKMAADLDKERKRAAEAAQRAAEQEAAAKAAREAAERASREAATIDAQDSVSFDTLEMAKATFADLSKADRTKFLAWVRSQLTKAELAKFAS